MTSAYNTTFHHLPRFSSFFPVPTHFPPRFARFSISGGVSVSAVAVSLQV